MSKAKTEYTKKQLINGQVETMVKRTKSAQLGELLEKNGWTKKDSFKEPKQKKGE